MADKIKDQFESLFSKMSWEGGYAEYLDGYADTAHIKETYPDLPAEFYEVCQKLEDAITQFKNKRDEVIDAYDLEVEE